VRTDSNDSSSQQRRLDRGQQNRLADVAKAGYAVTAFDRSKTRLVAARGQGISIASSPAEAVSRRPVITSLPDDAALRAVIVGPEGLVQAMAPKSILMPEF
jgi:3-hydroxyisobutyrate dehydrogenase-like beta-hydroxyacid dehydrogenase